MIRRLWPRPILQNRYQNTGSRLAALVTFLSAVLAASSAPASIHAYRLFKSETFSQTSNAQPSAPASYKGAADLLYSTPSELSSAQLTVASPLSPATLAPLSFGYSDFSKTYASASALDTDFPNNATYTYTISGGTLGTHSSTLSTPASSPYASHVPFLNGTDYSQLQEMDSTAPFQFTFDGFAPPGAGQALIILVLSRVSTGQNDFAMTDLNTQQTSFTVPAHTLLPSTAYVGDLLYSYNVSTTVFSAGFNLAQAVVEYDLHDQFAFTTAVPEPASLVLAVSGLISLAAWNCRRRGRV
jgi:hypothetical protein